MAFLGNFFRSFFSFPQASQSYRTGQRYLDYGKGITDSAISSLDSLDTDYQKRLAAGLPEDVARAYRVQQGRITDEASRSRAAFAQNLVARARATGGAITPQAALDAQIEQSASTANAEFNARNSLAADEAAQSLDYTNKILDAIERIRTTKLGAGISEQGIGSQIYRNALQVMLDRRRAIAATAASVINKH